MSAGAGAAEPPRREIWRSLRRHPRELPERLLVLAVGRQGPEAKAWAQERLAQGAQPLAESDRLRRETLIASRADGAVSGTPFFIALVPAYVAFLWAQARMVLRIAGLHGHDPTGPRVAAELLALRGVYPSVPEAAAALERMGKEPVPADEKPGRRRQVVMVVIGGAIWAVTWIIPVTFMILMAWSCDTSTRQLGAIALEYYSGVPVHDPRGVRALKTAPEHGSAGGRSSAGAWSSSPR